jgi:hypothetical protein
MENTMEMKSPLSMSSPDNLSNSSNKNVIIIVLVVLLLLSILGINILSMLGNLIQSVALIVGPFVTQVLSIFGYTLGTAIDKTEDVVRTTTKTGIDILGGAVDDVAGLLKSGYSSSPLDSKLMSSDYKLKTPSADSTTSPIQKPISSTKTNWCLVGEYEGRRGCVEIGNEDKCLSGQIFPNRQSCLNPTFMQDVSPLKPITTRL